MRRLVSGLLTAVGAVAVAAGGFLLLTPTDEWQPRGSVGAAVLVLGTVCLLVAVLLRRGARDV